MRSSSDMSRSLDMVTGGRRGTGAPTGSARLVSSGGGGLFAEVWWSALWVPVWGKAVRATTP
jgi:hypothetical protein